MHRHHLLPLVLFFLLLHATFSLAAGDGGGCDRQCNGAAVPYPFGFSGDCPILLTCNASVSRMPLLLPHSSSSNASSSSAAAAYPILSFNSTASTFLALLDPSCNRTVAAAAASLAGAGYGVSSRTGLFLRGGAACRAPATGSANCTVPADLMARLLRTAQCGGNDTAWTCVASVPPAPGSAAAERGQGQFMQWEMVNASGCEDALTAAVYGDTPQLAGVPSLQFGVAELGWWLDGNCTGGEHRCAANAACRDVETPGGAWGHRCACPDGMAGDGFAAGDGCRHAAASGQCSRTYLL